MTTVTTEDLKALFVRIAEAMEREKDRLCELDGVIGDADHGIAMELGFAAAAKAVSELDTTAADPTLVFNTAAKSFLNAVGASSGPLYATALMRAGAVAKGNSTLNDDDMVEIFAALAKGIQDRGKAEVGEKTMVDAWAPAAAACRIARDQGLSLADCFAAALKAGQAGAEATKDMVAAKGRSSRLGDRALGHMDPGAASAVVVIACFHDHFM
ncbi:MULTISPECIES: dihydroxyacetone kinase subunit DhaL [unclassified Rhizobium]|uniref:dihydroxyacetone kinase subunit DhaL n=1 Tax=unclassified Rhizobium TaxID=2613769 RepID=UPI00161528C0|nr:MULTISPECIES: dihydroxyacetone kinase subunit DhaL [unclassified Rhizobium]MBB3385166.1 dihydroxyacetone kinase-like protein [Rhizobium sp. BK098]MBB3616984.1 dihydroxyacetone kinase-like protein [Rhizobium sp. BK609]MBB3682641.1 dihydroxyacetone kinase-like protein [Rhizobium sp. BK612]